MEILINSTIDGFPIKVGEHYWLLITGKDNPIEVICTDLGHFSIFVKECNEDAPYWIREDEISVRNSDLVKQLDYATKKAKDRYNLLIKYYQEKMTTKEEVLSFPLRFDVRSNDAAKIAYILQIEKIFGFLPKDLMKKDEKIVYGYTEG